MKYEGRGLHEFIGDSEYRLCLDENGCVEHDSDASTTFQRVYSLTNPCDPCLSALLNSASGNDMRTVRSTLARSSDESNWKNVFPINRTSSRWY